MSAPARFPNPGDLARRTATTSPHLTAATAAGPQDAPSAAGLIAPGVLRPHELFRQAFQQGMRLSRMLPEARLVALTLLSYANFKTGLLNKYEPTTAELADATGLTQGQVLVQIEVLTQRGWLTRHIPTRGPRQGREVMQLLVPSLVLQQVRERRAAERPVSPR